RRTRRCGRRQRLCPWLLLTARGRSTPILTDLGPRRQVASACHHARMSEVAIPVTDSPGTRHVVRRVAGLFRPYRGRVALLAGLILASSGIGVVNPLLTKAVFDRALFPASGEPNMGLLAALVGVMIGIAIVGGVLGIGQTYYAAIVGQRVMQDLRD